jgi:hypothetical protein
MLSVSIYRWSDRARTKDGIHEVLQRYGDLGEDPGAVAHYIFADGSGGIVIADGPDSEHAYRIGLALGEFIDDVEEHTVLRLEDALPIVMKYAQ